MQHKPALLARNPSVIDIIAALRLHLLVGDAGGVGSRHWHPSARQQRKRKGSICHTRSIAHARQSPAPGVKGVIGKRIADRLMQRFCNGMRRLGGNVGGFQLEIEACTKFSQMGLCQALDSQFANRNQLVGRLIASL